LNLSRLAGLARLAGALAAELIAEARCALCDVPVGAAVPSRAFCARCEPPPRPPLTAELRCGLRMIALDGYEGALATVVKKLKYEGRTDLARPLGRRLSDAVHASWPILPEVVVAVPLHPKRLAERGYNQSALVARELAKSLELPFSSRALARLRSTKQQASLDKRERESNVAGAFEARARAHAHLRGKRILLVDDVVTTGATVIEAAAALLLSGRASEVSVASVLRADRHLLR